MTEQTKHTPIPVSLNLQDLAKTLIHVDAIFPVGEVRGIFSIPKGHRHIAEAICDRYNNHADLLAALEALLAPRMGLASEKKAQLCAARQRAREVLRRAKGGE